jgi:hypothetical protein
MAALRGDISFRYLKQFTISKKNMISFISCRLKLKFYADNETSDSNVIFETE